MALAAAGQWSRSLPWLHQAWRSAPENRTFAMELARAGHRSGGAEIARLAEEAIWDRGGFSDEEQQLGAINIHPAGDTPTFRLEPAGPREIERLFLLSGRPRAGFSKCWVLIAKGETDRITGGALLGTGGRIQLYLAPRWRKCRAAASTLLEGVMEDFRLAQGTARRRVEVFDSPELAGILLDLNLHESRTDERWRIPFAPLLARVVASWDKLKHRAANRYQILQGMPDAAILEQAMYIASAHGLANPRLVEWLADPVAARGFHRNTCNYVMDGERLAALVLSRSLSPSRIFVELRAVAPAYMHDSRCLNILAMMRPLSMGLAQGIESLELLGRRVEEAETLSMARRSNGTCLETRHVFEAHTSSPLISANI